VIPVKGERPFFDEAIESLRGQGMGEELEIIIQDGTTEYTEYTENDLRGVRWYREEDRGQSDALNKGFAKAKGEWLFWLNADDVLLPGALKKVLDRINRIDRIDWIAGDTVYIDEHGKVLEVRTDAKWRSWFGKKLSVWTGGPSAFFRRELWERCGGLSADLKYTMDIDLWTRWAKAGERFVGLGDYVWGFRVHGGSQTMNGENFAAQIAERKAIDAKYGVSSDGFWRNVTRVASVLDGSWSKRKSDTARLNGRLWSEIAQ
jgi:glycosyltransferase involved in cell wall biosynthesis